MNTPVLGGLDAFYLEDLSEMTLILPNGTTATVPTGEVDDDGQPVAAPITITLLRQSSEEAAKHMRKQAQRMVDAQKGRRYKTDADAVQEQTIKLAVFCTKSWKNVCIGGKVLDCNPANVENLYKDSKLSWLFKQVVAHMANDAEYLGNSQGS
jgi:hypothetical protein